MNEAETRAELIDPQLREAGWGVIDGSKILRERHITKGRIQAGGRGWRWGITPRPWRERGLVHCEEVTPFPAFPQIEVQIWGKENVLYS